MTDANGRRVGPDHPSGPRILTRETVHAGWGRFETLTVETEVAGRMLRSRREVFDHGDGAAVLAYDPGARTAVFVAQIRAGSLAIGHAEPILEVPAGLLDPGETAEACARRETLEETGLTLGKVEVLGAPFASPGSLTERVHLFLGVIDRSIAPARPRPEHDEAITIVELPL